MKDLTIFITIDLTEIFGNLQIRIIRSSTIRVRVHGTERVKYIISK